jgi:outer membrane protein with beta-barrel domain
MSRSVRIARALSAVAAGLALGLVLARPAQAENRKHHLSLTFGYFKYLSDDLKPSVDIDPGAGTTMVGADFTNGGSGALAYRLSLKPNLDLTLDAFGIVSQDDLGGVDITLSTSYFGPGIRLISPSEGMRPYVQANFYFVSEDLELEYSGITISGSESGVGFGISGGVDIRASNLISIPVEAHYLYSKPEDDVSGIGASVGLTFNFGMMK